MSALQDHQESEKDVRSSSDTRVLIKSEKEYVEPTEQKKGTNGFLVRLPELIGNLSLTRWDANICREFSAMEIPKSIFLK